jgi:hypothetical protein
MRGSEIERGGFSIARRSLAPLPALCWSALAAVLAALVHANTAAARTIATVPLPTTLGAYNGRAV